MAHSGESHQLLAMWFAVVFCLSSSVYARLEQRADPIVPLTIPLTLDGRGRYTAQVNMSSGSNRQEFKFALTTSIGYTTVAGIGCADSCGGVPLYDAAASPSSRALEAPNLNISFLDGGNATGHAIKEDCTLLGKSSNWDYFNQTIIVSQVSSSIYSDGVSGLIGMGGNSRDGNFSATQPAGWLDNHPEVSNFTFGMQLDKPRQVSGSSGGVLHWLAPMQSAYDGQVQWLNASTTSTGMDWNVPLTGWSSASGVYTPARTGNLRASIDPYYPDIYVPLLDSKVIFSGVAGATPRPGNSVSTVWNVPCATNMTFTLTFGNLTFTLDQSDLVVHESEASCTSAIQGWTDVDTTDFLLGGVFISSAYLIFQINRDEQGAIGFAKRTIEVQVANDPVSKGLIAGTSIGGTLVLVGLIGGIWLFCRSRNKKKKKKQLESEKSFKDAQERKPSVIYEPFDMRGVRNMPSLSHLQPSTPSSPRRVLVEEAPGSGIYVEAPSTASGSYYPERYTTPLSSTRSASSQIDYNSGRNYQRETYATYSPSETPTTLGENVRRSQPPTSSSLNEPISPTLLLNSKKSKHEQPPPRYAM